MEGRIQQNPMPRIFDTASIMSRGPGLIWYGRAVSTPESWG